MTEPSLHTTTSVSAWFNCQAGVAGDMVLAALVDAGAESHAIGEAIAGLGVDGYAMTFEQVQRCGVGATWANIVVDDSGAHQHTHRPAAEILRLLDEADIADGVRRRARAIFERLAAVEGEIHGVDPDDVELHEVGSLDSIIDVVGVCAALESLGVDVVTCSSIGLGAGLVDTAHGTLPHPAPATIRLLADARAPTHGIDTTLETATPTGAAVMTTLADRFGALPGGSVTRVGYGAGTADPPERANLVQVVLLDTDSGAEQIVVRLDANVDDVTGEVLAHTIATLMDAGALDAWVTPIVMKKGRPAHIVSVLCEPAQRDALRALLAAETGTLGVRSSNQQRWPEPRATASVTVDGHTIGVKVSAHRTKVEFDDAARAATALGLPVRVVIERAVSAADAAGVSGSSRS